MMHDIRTMTSGTSLQDGDDDSWNAMSKRWRQQQERRHQDSDVDRWNITGWWWQWQQDCHDRTVMMLTALPSCQDGADDDSRTVTTGRRWWQQNRHDRTVTTTTVETQCQDAKNLNATSSSSSFMNPGLGHGRGHKTMPASSVLCSLPGCVYTKVPWYQVPFQKSVHVVPDVNVNVNVFGNENVVYPLRISKQNYKRESTVNLLLISDDTKQHYCWIKDISKLLSLQTSKHGHVRHVVFEMS